MMDNSKRLVPLSSSSEESEDQAQLSEEDGLSLEELSQSYQQVLAKTSGPAGVAAAGTLPDSFPLESEVATNAAGSPRDPTEQTVFDPLEEPGSDAENCPLTPSAIVEAVLFLGRPDGGAVSAAEIAALIRGVHAAEVVDYIAELNATYEATGRATRIAAVAGGFRLQLADDLQFIRDRFYGRVRQVKLNQSAIDCLALIAYQPGISRESLEQQRGQPSGSVLNQLVRRQLIEMHRQSDPQAPDPKKTVPRYYPTERLFELVGIDSLDDLPQTEDF